jgi:hypothetical protein
MKYSGLIKVNVNRNGDLIKQKETDPISGEREKKRILT